MNELLENVVITDEFLEGMRVVGKALAKECKKQHLHIKEQEIRMHRCSDAFTRMDIREIVAEEKEKLAHCVEMKVLAEKFYKKAKHIRDERTHTDKEENKR